MGEEALRRGLAALGEELLGAIRDREELVALLRELDGAIVQAEARACQRACQQEQRRMAAEDRRAQSVREQREYIRRRGYDAQLTRQQAILRSLTRLKR